MTEKELLKKIMSCFYESSLGGVEWSYIGGTKIKDILGEEIETELKKYMPSND